MSVLCLCAVSLSFSGRESDGVCVLAPQNTRVREYQNTRIGGPQPCRWVSAGQVSVIKFVMSCRHGKRIFECNLFYFSAFIFISSFALARFPFGIFLWHSHSHSNIHIHIHIYIYRCRYRDGELQLLLCSRLWHVYFCLYSISYDF